MDELLGHVDGVRDTTITGWIANATRPGLLESVWCVGSCGREVEFKAVHFRSDVCEAVGHLGRFGFVIPVSALHRLTNPLSIRDRLGQTLANGADIVRPEQTVPGALTSEQAMIFLHIPKTAGTSVRNAIVDDLQPHERLLLYPGLFGLTTRELASLPLDQRRSVRLLAGHTYFGIADLIGKRSKYVTFLRETQARLRSHFAHHGAAGTVFERGDLRLNLPLVANEGLDEEFDNLTVRTVAGLPASVVPLGEISERDIDLAMWNMQEHFAMVGFVETIETDMVRLERYLGRPLKAVRHDNARTVGSLPDELMSAVDWDRIEHRNRFDQMLYDRVRESGVGGPRLRQLWS